MPSFVSVLCALCLLVVVESYHVSTFPRSSAIKHHHLQLKSPHRFHQQSSQQGLQMTFLNFGNGKTDKAVPIRSFLSSTQRTLKDLSNRVQKQVFLPLFFIASALYAFLSRAAIVHAKSSGNKGWGLYGRIPYDDWLFTTDKLIDPNLLRKSLIEAVSIELPVAVASSTRKELIGSIISASTISLLFLIPLGLLINVLAPFFKRRFNQRMKKLYAVGGIRTSITAKYKNQPEKEKPIIMGEVVDMSAWRYKKDEKPKKPKKENDKDNDKKEGEETTNEKKKKKPSDDDDDDDDDDGKWNWNDDEDDE